MHKRRDILNVENQHKHNWGGEGAHCITTFFSDGLVRERYGGRKRCLLWRKVCALPPPHRSRRPAMTALQTRKSQLEQRFIPELQEHVKGICVFWRTAWKASRSTCTFCTRIKCSDATAMSSASRYIVWGNGHYGTVVLPRCFLFLPYHNVLQAGGRSLRCL